MQAVIIHKTDTVICHESFKYNALQLAAYGTYLSLSKPLIDIGINWVVKGELQMLTLDS
jgi:hypothetical protein